MPSDPLQAAIEALKDDGPLSPGELQRRGADSEALNRLRDEMIAIKVPDVGNGNAYKYHLAEDLPPVARPRSWQPAEAVLESGEPRAETPCEECGDPTDNRRFCSPGCYHASKRGARVEIECERCATPISVPPAEAENRRFCSPECFVAQERAAAGAEPDGTFIECDYCGSIEAVQPAKADRRFCSRECYNAHQRVQNGAPPEGITIECDWCGAEESVPPARSDKRFCGDECRIEWMRARASAGALNAGPAEASD